MKKSMIFLFAVLSFAACKDADITVQELETNSDDYMIFGTYHGFCMGDCTHLYKLEKGKLYPDAVERVYPSAEQRDSLIFSETPLAQELYALAKTLRDSIPNELLTTEEERIGCPDCADQGGIYIEIKIGDTIKSWNIDTQESSLPAYLIPYTRKVKEVMAELGE